MRLLRNTDHASLAPVNRAYHGPGILDRGEKYALRMVKGESAKGCSCLEQITHLKQERR